jgi:hypothetical protein
MNSGFYFLEAFFSTSVSYSLRVGVDTAKQSQEVVEPNGASNKPNLYRGLSTATASSTARSRARWTVTITASLLSPVIW